MYICSTPVHILPRLFGLGSFVQITGKLNATIQWYFRQLVSTSCFQLCRGSLGTGLSCFNMIGPLRSVQKSCFLSLVAKNLTSLMLLWLNGSKSLQPGSTIWWTIFPEECRQPEQCINAHGFEIRCSTITYGGSNQVTTYCVWVFVLMHV